MRSRLNGAVVTGYTFKQNYYWMMGIITTLKIAVVGGFVPEDHIVGKPNLSG
jgi:signal peptidase I